MLLYLQKGERLKHKENLVNPTLPTNPTFIERTMKTMKRMPLITQGSKQHLTKLFLEVNKKKQPFGFLCIFM